MSKKVSELKHCPKRIIALCVVFINFVIFVIQPNVASAFIPIRNETASLTPLERLVYYIYDYDNWLKKTRKNIDDHFAPRKKFETKISKKDLIFSAIETEKKSILDSAKKLQEANLENKQLSDQIMKVLNASFQGFEALRSDFQNALDTKNQDFSLSEETYKNFSNEKAILTEMLPEDMVNRIEKKHTRANTVTKKQTQSKSSSAKSNKNSNWIYVCDAKNGSQVYVDVNSIVGTRKSFIAKVKINNKAANMMFADTAAGLIGGFSNGQSYLVNKNPTLTKIYNTCLKYLR